MLHLFAAVVMVALVQQVPPPAAVEVDSAIRQVVERFFETQAAEDVEAYLALWSAKAKRPRPEQLEYIFKSGDDRFEEVAITRATVTGDTARVRVSAIRVRTDPRVKMPDGTPRPLSSSIRLALSLVREEDGWKIVREGSPADELAAALIEADDPSARRALLASEPDLLDARLADAIARRADALAQMEQYGAAQAIYERALEVARLAGSRKAEGQALQNVANSLYFQRDFAGALRLYDERLALERDLGNDEGVANALLGMGTVQYSTYEYSAALESYRAALAIQEKQNDELLISTTLISTGNVLYVQGDYDAAIADYRRAEILKRKYHDLAGAATALEGLGRVYSSQGDYAAALGAFTRVLEERRKRSDVPRAAIALQAIGDIHFRLGNTDQARTSFDESRRGFESVKDVASAGRVLQGTAVNELVAGRFGEGEKAYTESITLCTRVGDQECIARAQVGLAFALAAQKRFDDAITWYVRSLSSFNALRMEDPLARARIGLAEALAGKEEYARAIEEAVAARHTAVVLESDDVLWRALVSQARAERRLGKRIEALGTARAGLLAVQRMAAAALDRPGPAVPRDTETAYATVAILQAEAGDAAGAFTTVEAMRAHALRLSLATNERDIARGMTDEERAEELRLGRELTALVVKRDRQKELPKPDKAALQRLDEAIAEMTARRTAAREKLFHRLPELRIWRGLAPAATAAELASLVDAPGTALLQLVVDERDVLIITVQSAQGLPAEDAQPVVAAHVIAVDRQELAERVGRAMDGRALASVEGWRKASAELFGMLPGDVTQLLSSASSLTVVADDVLWRVPFEAMPSGAGFLADRTSVAYAPSVTAILRAPAPSPVSVAPSIVAVAAPELPVRVLDELKTTAPTWNIRSAEAGAAEAARITASAAEPRAVALTGADASEIRLKELRRSSAGAPGGALHIAAPFRINSAGPLFSPILLTPSAASNASNQEGEPPADTGELEARELFGQDPLGSVVMFSDPAALSKRDAAAAASVVHWAWRASGATTTIYRRWGGDEGTAAEIIARFYDALRAGKTARDALDAARAAVRSSEEGRAPAAWAGWLILTGR